MKTVKEWSWEKSIDYLEKVIKKEKIEEHFNMKDNSYSYEKERERISRN